MSDEPKRELLPGEAEVDAWIDTLEQRADAMSDDYNDGYTHEALHTVLVLMETFEEHVSDSRCADEFPEIKAAAEVIHRHLFELYQNLGAKMGSVGSHEVLR